MLVPSRHSARPEELEISRICLRFNRAFLAESTGEIAEAVSEYISMQEERESLPRRRGRFNVILVESDGHRDRVFIAQMNQKWVAPTNLGF